MRSRNDITKKTARSLLAGAFTTALLMLQGGSLVLAAKPGGGGGSGPIPPGTIYYSTSAPGGGFNGCWSMTADGAGKTPSPCGEPSRQLHGGRWFLEMLPDQGTFPNGAPRREVFAASEDGLAQVRLTDDPDVQVALGPRWAFDDSFVSFAAVYWTAVGPGQGNFTDSQGQEWLANAAVYVVPLDWSNGSPVAGPPIPMLDAGLYFDSTSAWDSFHPLPDTVALDWSPAGDRIVYQKVTQDSPGGREYHDLYVTSFDAQGGTLETLPLGPGRGPEWSPDGGRIAFTYFDSATNAGGIWTVRPDGSQRLQVPKTLNYDGNPKWSPDSAHLAFLRPAINNAGGVRNYAWDVFRIPASGGTAVNLTKDLSDDAGPRAWR